MKKYAFLVPLALGVVLAGVVLTAGQSGDDDDAVMAPMFEVDPLWPKNLPNHWLMGPTIGVDVDAQDNIWVLHRNTPNNFQGATEIGMVMDPPVSECCQPGPPVLVFDQDGNLVDSWGGPGTETGDYMWPESNHGIAVDHMDNVWIGGNGGDDSHALKFSHTGEFLLQVGEDGFAEPDSSSRTRYQKVAKVTFDDDANEAYLADGYGNKRVAVVDGTTGELKRFWGAYGNTPSDDELPRYDLANAPAHGAVSKDKSGTPQFRNPVHCADPTNDGLVYACDRPGNRVQVFTKAGEFVEEIYLMTKTLGSGSAWDIAFSTDPDQTFAYVADGMNEKVHVLRRKPLEYIYSFGSGGRMAGQFFGNHSIAVDSSGNVYTTETFEGKRVQRFKYKGMGNAKGDVGVPLP
jgi:DNA-binding beta-propeller fold protein YncE